LRLERIDWSTSAQVLEKIMEYEAVHDISDWEDLQNRVAAPDKRLYAFFHPALPNEPLIFIEVALLNEAPSSIMSILDKNIKPINPLSASTAAFYSISNCQMGLKNVSFGSFLIKQVVAEIEQELKQVRQFITLSPVPGLKKWAEQNMLSGDKELPENIAKDIQECCGNNKPNQLALTRVTYYFITQVKRKSGQAINSVAHFHLGNGASLNQIHLEANTNKLALEDSWGVMVNYLYDSEAVAKNHEDYANLEPVAISSKLTKNIQGNKKKILAYTP
jgi:malonyl-CoA decarboxylase